MCGGGSDAEGPGSASGGRGGGFGGAADSVGGGFGMSSVSGNTAAGVGGAGYGGGNRGSSGNRGGAENNTPAGLRSIEDAHKGLAIAGPQLSRARDNAAATNLSYGLKALGLMTGFLGFNAAASLVTAARDYGRGYADRTDMEKAADAIGMGAPQRGGDDSVSGGLRGVARPMAKAPAKAAASGNVGSGAAGATVIMGAEKTRTGAGAGGRAKGSAVRGFGSGGLKL